MIVFTATHRHTQAVFVGKAQDSVEEEWAQLLSQAESGVEGVFFDGLREDTEAFAVETWGYAETPAEVRECFNEARQDLGAEVIKTPRSKPANSNAKPIRTASMKALMDSIRDAAESYSDEDSLDWNESNSDDQSTNSDNISEPQLSQPVADVNKVDSAQLDEAKLAARIESMKAAQAKVLQQKEAQARKAKLAGAESGSLKLAAGRTGSSVKEQRIRATIEQEREAREQNRTERGREEQAEMNALMARVELRRQAQKDKKKAAAKKRITDTAKAQKKASTAVKPLEETTLNPKDERSKEAVVVAKQAVEVPESIVVSEPVGPESESSSQKVLQSVAEKPEVAAGAQQNTQDSPQEKSKEERMREAMAKQRTERMALRRSKTSQEGDEMSKLLTRLDASTRDARRSRRRS